MAFELGTITEEDLPFIFPEVHDETLNEKTLPREGAADFQFYSSYHAKDRKEIVGRRWIVDKDRRVFVTFARGGVYHNSGYAYLVGWEAGKAIVRNCDYCLYEIRSVTDDLLPRVEQLKPLIAEALALGGVTLEGVSSRYYDAVPNAEFLPYPNKGA